MALVINCMWLNTKSLSLIWFFFQDLGSCSNYYYMVSWLFYWVQLIVFLTSQTDILFLFPVPRNGQAIVFFGNSKLSLMTCLWLHVTNQSLSLSSASGKCFSPFFILPLPLRPTPSYYWSFQSIRSFFPFSILSLSSIEPYLKH